MIYESYPWKQDLLRRRRLFLKYNTVEALKNSYDRAYTVLEKSVFYSAFIIRKLLDCRSKLSDEAESYSLCVDVYKSLKKVHLFRNWPDEQSHDWDHPWKETVNGRDICNWLIHSYIFGFEFDKEEDGIVEGFFLSSDRYRNKSLYYVKICDWLAYIEFVANDNLESLTYKYNDDNKVDNYVFCEKKRGLSR